MLKKFKIIYFILFIVLVLLTLTGGIEKGVVIKELHDPDNAGYITLCIYNIIILCVMMIFMFFITFNKKNVIKRKYLILILFLLMLFLSAPIGFVRTWGIDGKPHKINLSPLIFHVFYNQ